MTDKLYLTSDRTDDVLRAATDAEVAAAQADRNGIAVVDGERYYLSKMVERDGAEWAEPV